MSPGAFILMLALLAALGGFLWYVHEHDPHRPKNDRDREREAQAQQEAREDNERFQEWSREVRRRYFARMREVKLAKRAWREAKP